MRYHELKHTYSVLERELDEISNSIKQIRQINEFIIEDIEKDNRLSVKILFAKYKELKNKLDTYNDIQYGYIEKTPLSIQNEFNHLIDVIYNE